VAIAGENFVRDFIVYLLEDRKIVRYLDRRLFSGKVPMETKFPYVVYGIVDRDGVYNFSSPSDLVAVTVRFDVYADWQRDILGIYESFRGRLDGFNGLMGTTDIRYCMLVNMFDNTSFVRSEGSENRILHRYLEFEMTYVEGSS